MKEFTETERLEALSEALGLTYGFEFEAALPVNKSSLAYEMQARTGDPVYYNDSYHHHDGSGWMLSYDGSIRTSGHPVEIQSPVFRSPEALFGGIRSAVSSLATLHARAGRSCGFHIHVSPRYGWTRGDAHKVALLYARFEAALDFLQPAHRRWCACAYARSLWDCVPYTKAPLYNHFLSSPIGEILPADRYCKLNVLPAIHAHGTIEVRHSAAFLRKGIAESWARIIAALFCSALKADVEQIEAPAPRPCNWQHPAYVEDETAQTALPALAGWIKQTTSVNVASDIINLAKASKTEIPETTIENIKTVSAIE